MFRLGLLISKKNTYFALGFYFVTCFFKDFISFKDFIVNNSII